MAALSATPSGREQLRAYWTYALYTSQLRLQGLCRLLRQRLGRDVETTMISTGERMERRARRQGRAEGRAEGLDQGQALLILRLLTAPTLAKVFAQR